VPLAGRTHPREARIRKRRDFERIHRGGIRVHAGPFVILGQHLEGATRARLGLAIGRRVGNAVVRNRLRRLAREAFRSIASELPPVDLVVIAKPEAKALAESPFDRLASVLIPGLRKVAQRAAKERS
jgi:ribonuclease P protein component